MVFLKIKKWFFLIGALLSMMSFAKPVFAIYSFYGNCFVSSTEPTFGLGVLYFDTIQEAVNKPRCKKIYVDGGNYYERLTITRPLTLIGSTESVVKIDGNIDHDYDTDDGSVIIITSDGSDDPVVLQNLKIQNGADAIGGGISDSGAPLEIENVTFYNNKANYGGAIYLDGADLKISNTDFSDNYASSFGGAVFVTRGKGFDIQSTSFYRNIAFITGGGVYLDMQNATTEDYTDMISFHDTTFENNKALSAFGGALFISHLYDFDPDENPALDPSILNRSVLLQNSDFSENFAESDGGAINIQYVNSIKMISSTLSENETNSGNGGGYYASDNNSNVIQDSLFENNITSSGHGGGYRSSYNNLDYIQSSSFEGNTADSGYGGGIQMIYTNSSIIESSSFSGNSAYAGGGLFQYYPYTSVKLLENDFKENFSAQSGGGYYLYAPDSDPLDLSIEGSRFESNTANDDGGGSCIVTCSESDLKLSSTEFNQNTSLSGEGGGAFIFSYRFEGQDLTFSENTAENSLGGGLYVLSEWEDSCPIEDSGKQISLEDSQFVANVSGDNGGGAVVSNYDTAVFKRLEFSENEANGSASALDASVGNMNLSESYFSLNHLTSTEEAATGGAANIGVEESLVVTDVNFLGNTGPNVSAFAFQTEKDATLERVYFEENVGDRILSAISEITDSGSKFDMTDVLFTSNTGRVSIDDFYQVNLEKIVAMENTVNEYGLFYLTNTGFITGTVDFKNSTIANNSGDPIYLYAKNLDLNLENTTLAGNILQAAAVNYVSSGTLTVKNSTIANNENQMGYRTTGFYLTGRSLTKLAYLVFENSIIANNHYFSSDGTITYSNCDVYTKLAVINSKGHNIESDNDCSLTDATDQSDTDPKLMDLGYYGDSSDFMTMPPASSDSPAVDQGNSATCPTTDQIGHDRNDGNGDGTIACDIGAYEYQI